MSLGGSTLSEWLAQLETLSPTEIVLGLDRVVTMLGRLDLPQPKHVFHVAGTNGKGSSVAMLQALLASSGERIGSYTSPHVSRYNERIIVDGDLASDVEIMRAFERIEAVRYDLPLTYFEFGTLAAMVVFADAKIETVVLEVGMGGRLDAVNAIEPEAGLITNVSLDHCDWLGYDVESIGTEKAGIMRSGKPVVFASADVPSSVMSHADAIGAELIVAGRDYQYSRTLSGWSWQGHSHGLPDLQLPSLPGDVQITNAAGVLALVEAAGRVDLLQKEVVDAAFGGLKIKGRMQSVSDGTNWLLDVAHNPAAAAALADMLRSIPVAGQTIGIIALRSDKDVAGVITPLVGLIELWIAVTAQGPRAIPGVELARQIANLSNSACLVAESVDDAIAFARARATADDRVLVTGSFYVVGPVLDSLELYSRRKS